MSGETPGQAELRDLIRKRWNEVLRPPDFPDTDQVMASLAAETALGALAAQQPQPAPELAAAMRETASRELAAAMAESRRYREALQEVAGHDNDPITQVRIVARAARRALEAK